MTPTRWQHIQEVVNEALEYPSEARATFLDRTCGTDPDLLGQVRGLIESYERADSFLERAAGAGASDVLRPQPPAEGERIGPYEIGGIIGAGGMGAVYRARRVDDQFRQTVAIKVLRGGVANADELEARFRAERQILARLTHPNIARLLDGGITRTGLPYLVMEYIEGASIDAFIRQSACDINACIDLFRQVCSAVQYAHQNLIVHRDIKPANIMVTEDGIPKLLDFGIAKLLSPDPISDGIPLTRPAERLMTPEYASPEQVRGEPVTTATDVYALGVLLYELLSGQRPFRAADLTPTALERMICETTPERPSVTAVASAEPRGENIGADLDNIVLKALHKDPARRYVSAGELSEDLRRYQQGFPVLARADSWCYRTSRFVSRHRFGTAAAMIFAVTVTALTAGLALETRRERLEAATAGRISDFMVSLFQDFSPEANRGRTAGLRDILERGAERIPTELSAQPLVEARLYKILGTTYQQFGEFSRAESLLNHALTIYSRTFSPRSREAAECLLSLAAIASDRGNFTRSGELYQKALATFTALDGTKSEKAAQAIEGLGEVRRMLGDLDGAKQRYLEAIALYTELDGPTHLRTLSAKNDLVAVVANQGDYSAAESLARENVGNEKAALGAGSPDVAFTLNLLAYVLGRTARFAEATADLREALEIQRKVYGAEHPAIALNLADLSALERELGHYAESEQLAAQSLAMSVKLSGPRSLGTANCQGQLGLTELALGNHRRAHELLQAALETRAALGNPNNPDLAENYDRLGMADLAMRNLSAAHRNIARGMEIRQTVYGPKNENVVRSLNHMARVLAAEKNYEAAAERYREAIAISDETFQAGHVITADALFGLGSVLISEGRPADARLPLSRALAIRRKLLPAVHPAIAEAAAALVQCSVASR
ncbi:MAG TPA: serine/threonine-protein kinase [Bryobacteraceae bacterium]|nr:serine/threonine-protein kinase [Bryobacteraceae bacterium]